MDHQWGQRFTGNPWYYDFCLKCLQRKNLAILECSQEIERKALLKVKDKPWFVYILKCNDDTLYTGITNNLWQRFLNHKNGKGSKYTKSHGADIIVYSKKIGSKSEAYKREYQIKQLTRDEKLALIKDSL